jgi:NAD dependent epimerase/dehydratase
VNIEGKRVLVTGADGFIGSHLVELLVSHKAHVRALAWYNAQNNWGWLDDINCREDIEVVTGDIRDSHQCRTFTDGTDVVFNLAALIGIPFSYRAPESYIQTNVLGTLNLLQAVRDQGCERFVHVSTSEVYGSAVRLPIDESHPLQPQSPYAASKVAADALAVSFHKSFDLPVVVARPFNTYGPRQSARAVIPTITLQMLDNPSHISLGNTTPTRDLMYVEDTCSGLVKLAECDNAVGETVNLGTGTELSIAELTSSIAAVIGCDPEIKVDSARVRPAASEVDRLCCDPGRARELTGFSCQTVLAEGLARTVEWFSRADNRALYKSDIYNL